MAFGTDESILFIEVSSRVLYCALYRHRYYTLHRYRFMSYTYIVIIADATVPEVHYSTVEVFPNKGMRVTGHVGSVLIAQLTPTTAKTKNDDRGW